MLHEDVDTYGVPSRTIGGKDVSSSCAPYVVGYSSFKSVGKATDTAI